MIKLENVNKYFNMGTPRQIHVIDNTSMVLPDKGIVTFLGPSGCGKTTLLNAIGGLDSVNAGRILINDKSITYGSTARIDDIRNASIGYIFQNFNLLDDKTVTENVAIALRMAGVEDEEVISERVRYCLERVGIYQFRNRRASALSGGQRQRVAIARAIVKNPEIIIADEPTGNLDSANTLEIMNLIKAISKDMLVVLVTHERRIAEFYSDYIAEIKDGKIVKAYDNDSSGYLDYQLENRIYLKDMPVQAKIHRKNFDVSMFSDQEENGGIKVVLRGNNLYIDTGGRYNIVDETGNIELIDEHYKPLDSGIYSGESFEREKYLPENFKAKYKSQYPLGRMLSSGWATVRSFKKIRKVLLLGFVCAAMFTFLALSNVMGIFDVQPKDYRTTNVHYLTVSNTAQTDDLIKLVESLDNVTYAYPGSTRISVELPLDDYYQTASASEHLNVSVAELAGVKRGQIIYGRYSTHEREVILDKMVADEFFRDGDGVAEGITEYEQLIDRRISIPEAGEYTICGICDTESPSLYVNKSQMMYILANAEAEVDDLLSLASSGKTTSLYKVLDKDLAPEDMTISEGAAPDGVGEVAVNEEFKELYKLGETIDASMTTGGLKVVGYYHEARSDNNLYVSSETIYREYVSNHKNFTVYSKKPETLLALLQEKGLTAAINDARDKNAYIMQMKDSLISSLIVAGIILLISLIEMFLMLRSSFLERIREIGILRAIGLKKGDVYRMFTGEILVITFITAIPGIALMYLLMTNAVKITDYLAGQYMITPLIAAASFAIVLVFNLIVGLIPVWKTMRKRPAEILARTDI